MQIGAREKRGMVIAGVAVAAYLIYAFVLSPTVEKQKRIREELEATRLLLTRYQATVGKRNQTLGDLNQGKTKLTAFETRLLSANKPPLAASQLQQVINEVAAKAAIDIRTTTILGPSDKGAYVEIPISLVFVGNSLKLKALLQEIDGHRLLLTVKELAINVINPDIENNIQVTMVVSSFTKKEG